MSFKPIDVQTSIPRVMELSPIQHQQQQRSATEQTLLGQQVVKHAEEQANRSTKTESTSNGTISDRDPRNRNHHSSDSRQDQNHSPEETKQAEHPYKGKHIDFTG